MRERNRPSELGREAGKHLARFCDQEELKKTILRPRCGSCAFKLGTFANGCAGTVMDALKCSMEHRPFMCHEDKSGETVCTGWMLMRSKEPIEVDWPFFTEP